MLPLRYYEIVLNIQQFTLTESCSCPDPTALSKLQYLMNIKEFCEERINCDCNQIIKV